MGVRALTSVGFAVAAGTVIPRDFDLYPLPPSILTLVPAYRGYRFFEVRDQIVIVDPATYEIVDVID